MHILLLVLLAPASAAPPDWPAHLNRAALRRALKAEGSEPQGTCAGHVEGGPFRALEWDESARLMMGLLPEPPDGASPPEQLGALGLESSGEVLFLSQPDTCGWAPGRVVLHGTTDPRLHGVAWDGRVRAVARYRHPWVETDDYSITEVLTLEEKARELRRAASERGPWGAWLLVHHQQLVDLPQLAPVLAELEAEVRELRGGGPEGRLDAALATAEASLQSADLRTWTEAWTELRDAAADSSLPAFRAREDRLRAYERDLQAALDRRQERDDVIGLVIAAAQGEPPDALRARAVRWLAARAPRVAGDGASEDGAARAWETLSERSASPGPVDLPLPSWDEVRAVPGQPLHLTLGAPELDVRMRVRDHTARKGLDDVHRYDNSAAVAAWAVELAEWDAKIAAWYRGNPYGQFDHAAQSALDWLQDMRAQHLARKPAGSGLYNEWQEVTWTVSCQEWTGRAKQQLSIGSEVEVVYAALDAQPTCRQDARPQWDVEAFDHWRSRESVRAELERRLEEARGEAVELAILRTWQRTVLADAGTDLERALRSAWLLGGPTVQVIVPKAPIEPPPARSAVAGAMHFVEWARACDDGLADCVLPHAACTLPDVFRAFPDICPRYHEAPTRDQVKYLRRAEEDAVEWAACVATADSDDARRACRIR